MWIQRLRLLLQFNFTYADFQGVVFQVECLLLRVVAQFTVGEELERTFTSSSFLICHSASNIIVSVISISNGLLVMVVVVFLIDYLDCYEASKWPLQILIKWTLHYTGKY